MSCLRKLLHIMYTIIIGAWCIVSAVLIINQIAMGQYVGMEAVRSRIILL